MTSVAQLTRRIGAILALGLAAVGAALAADTVGTTFPADFPVITDASLGTPVIGFGAAGVVKRTPVIFLHGNNDTPYATACNPYGRVQAMAQFFADNGYAASELWGLGYQGDQCDLLGDQTLRSSQAHTDAANVPDLRNFVNAVLRYTGAKEVDIVAHSLGVTLTREWVRQDKAQRLVRRFVAIDCGTRPRPRRAAGSPGVMTTPSIVSAPASGARRPAASDIRVDLPAPLGPRSPKNSPRAMSRDTPSSAVSAP